MSEKLISLKPSQISPALQISVRRQAIILMDSTKAYQESGNATEQERELALEYGTLAGLLTALTLVDRDAGAELANQCGLMGTVTNVMRDLSRHDIAQRAGTVTAKKKKGDGLYV